MKVSELLTELKETEKYKNFKTENPEVFFCSAMFILGDTDIACPNQIKPQICEGKIDLNFFLPKQNRISTFSMPFASLTNHQEEIKDQTEIKNLDFKIDVCDLKKFIEDKTGKKFSKLIAVLHEGVWNLTCLNGLDMSRMSIDAYTGETKKKSEGNLIDMVRIKKSSEQ